MSLRTRARFWYLRANNGFEKEIHLIPKLVKNFDGAIDIGANYGVYTYQLSRIFSHVDSFEPQPWCVKELIAGGIQGVKVHPVALSDRCGEAQFYIPTISNRENYMLGSLRRVDGDAVTIPVKMMRLDDFNFKSIEFIKIDVEGHELEVLKGALETLKKFRLVLLV